jgi:RNA polymerase sigma factor (sigma-70 family)
MLNCSVSLPNGNPNKPLACWSPLFGAGIFDCAQASWQRAAWAGRHAGRVAGRLSSGTVLSGWLFQTTRFLSADVMKSELRRKQREEHAAMMSRNLESHDGELLENLAPVLDDSVGDLKAAERDAIFLRYFQRKSYHEISLALGTTEEAARKRVERAVDKMREFFKKRGFTVSGAGLAGSIESQFAQSAPQALTAAVLQTVMSAPACTLTSRSGCRQV